MVMEALELEITELTPTEAARIWKRQTKRAPNFDSYLMYMQTHGVGHSWNVAVPLDRLPDQVAADAKVGDSRKLADGRTATIVKQRDGSLAWMIVSANTDDKVKTIKHNFGEAAKERTEFRDVGDLVTAQRGNADAPKSGDTFKLADGRIATFGTDGKWTAETPAPVMIKWKANTRKENRSVSEGGKKSTIEVTIVTSLDGLIVASDAVQSRGPRAVTEDVTALVTNPPADAKKGAKIDLADGRKAIKTASGKWRAPALQTPPTTNGATDGTAGLPVGNQQPAGAAA